MTTTRGQRCFSDSLGVSCGLIPALAVTVLRPEGPAQPQRLIWKRRCPTHTILSYPILSHHLILRERLTVLYLPPAGAPPQSVE